MIDAPITSYYTCAHGRQLLHCYCIPRSSSCIDVKKDLSANIVVRAVPRGNKDVHRVPIPSKYIADVVAVYPSLYSNPECRIKYFVRRVQRCNIFSRNESDLSYCGGVAWRERCPDRLGICSFYVQSPIISRSDLE